VKIAISGKGGVGKSTIAAAIALTLAKKGQRVLALDADPDANFAAALGIPSNVEIPTISAQMKLIEERTGATVNEYGRVFKLNPEVSDVAGKFSVRHNNVDLLVLGAIKHGGSGCACPESTFIRALVNDLVLYKNETLIMDMEAGIEHLGRSTSMGVDVMLIVTEPGQRSIDCAKTVINLSKEIGLNKFLLVGNKVMSEEDKQYIKDAFPDQEITVFLPFSENIRQADRDGISALDAFGAEEKKAVEEIVRQLTD